VRVFWTALALLIALLLETAAGAFLSPAARVLDPFLLVVVYCALVGGEVHGMLAAVAAGWTQDVLFGGPVAGVSALTKIIVAFVVGRAAGRFLIAGPGGRALVLLLASLGDDLLHQWFASVFDLNTPELGPLVILSRAVTCAIVGAGLYELLERRLPRETLP
jgi:rod shape-determining protein MreD